MMQKTRMQCLIQRLQERRKKADQPGFTGSCFPATANWVSLLTTAPFLTKLRQLRRIPPLADFPARRRFLLWREKSHKGMKSSEGREYNQNQVGFIASHMNTPSHNVTELLLAWQSGDKEALNKLIPLVN